MHYTVHELASILQAETNERSLVPDIIVEFAEVDSRSVINPGSTVFFALKGSRLDGHQFIPELIHSGVQVFVVSQIPEEHNDGVSFLKVPNVLRALQHLAAHHRKRFNIPVIGITGSNGKTIVKEWLFTMLHDHFKVCKNPKSFNSQLGVALSVLQLNEHHELALFEAGISQVGEMEALRNMIQPTLGILTNIGDAHQSGFSGIEEKTREKLSLFAEVPKIIYCKDYQSITYHRRHFLEDVSWSQKWNAEYRILSIRRSREGLHLLLQQDGHQHAFVLHFQDEASLENIMHCIVMCLELGLSQTEIQQGIDQLHNLSMRLEQREGIQGCLLINDSYSLDLKSLQLALQFVDQQNQSLPRTLVITDFAGHRDHLELFEGLCFLLEKYHIRKFVAVGNEIARIKPLLPPQIVFFEFPSTEALLDHSDALGFRNELLLIKGSRKFGLERLFHQLSLSRHDTILEIDLKAVSHNLDVYRSLLPGQVQVMAIVKAAAYGSGHYEIARLLEHSRVDYLAVAYTDEGILLRQKGIQLPIMVMNTGLVDFGFLMEYRLEPEIFSLQQMERCLEELKDQTSIPIHIKLDSGMHRLGFQAADIAALCEIIAKNPSLNIKSIFTHLSASDQPAFDDFTRQQASSFEEMVNPILNVLPYKPLLHVLNSGGIARHPELSHSMVRLGIGLYGFDADPSIQQRLEKVHTLKTRIAQIKHYPAGETVSYNRSGVLSAPSRIGVLSIGYADGLPRIAGTRAYRLWMNRQRVPLVGLVCMDMCMVDLSSLDNVTEGMEVEVFGKNAALEELSSLCDTIPYEILSGISGRVKRIFLQD